MQFLLEILKILEGGMNADRSKVIAYGQQLSDKVELAGEHQIASRIRRVLKQSKFKAIEPARLTSSRLPVDTETRLALADEANYDVGDVQLFLDEEQENIISEFLRYIQNADKLLAHGIGISPSLLLHGPPGCGKSQLAKMVAARLNLPLITSRLDTIVSSLLGSTSKNIRYLFEHIDSRPCVLFLDEFDAIAKLRDDQNELGELKRVVVSLLQNIDNLDEKTVLLAATNHPHLLDSAVWRRFSYKIEIGLPNKKVREQIVQNLLRRSGPDSQTEMLTEATEGLSGDTIKNIIESALRDAILSNKEKIDDILILTKIISLKGISTYNSDDRLDEIIYRAKQLNPKVFTHKRLSQIFNRSTGYISTHLKTEAKKHV